MDEIEFGIFAEKRKPYPDAIQKMDAVIGKVSELLLPTMVN